MLVQYINKRFAPETLAVIEQANDIIDDLQSQGYTLSLRQLYYQFVARDVFPDSRRWTWTGSKWVRDPAGTKNAEPNYKWLGSIVSDGRMAGVVPWDAIEDRTRQLESQAQWDSTSEIIKACVDGYHVDWWAGQPVRPEVWIEKDALTGVIEPVCRRYDVSYFACKGYVSMSSMWRAAQRIEKRFVDDDQRTVIFYFGDHDPSGLDMTKDIEGRLFTFIGSGDEPFKMLRLGLNWDQIQQYQPPPNPTKLTDARAKRYVAEFGNSSWELDALSPAVIEALIQRAVESTIDNLGSRAIWDVRRHLDQTGRDELRTIAAGL